MLVVVIERFDERNLEPVYRRLRDEGRMMPEVFACQGSWVQADFDGCFQLVECEDVGPLKQRAMNWQDVVEFEIVPVVEGGETVETIEPLLD